MSYDNASYIHSTFISINGSSPRSVVENILDCDIGVKEFELQSRYYVHFQTNTIGITEIP